MKSFKYAVLIFVIAALATGCSATSSPMKNGAVDKQYTMLATTSGTAAETSVLPPDETLREIFGDNNYKRLLAVCEILGIRVETIHESFGSYTAAILTVRTVNVIFSGEPLPSDEFDLMFFTEREPSTDIFELGEQVVLFVTLYDNPTETGIVGVLHQRKVLYVTDQNRLIPMTQDSYLTAFGGLQLDAAQATALDIRNERYTGERYEETQPLIQKINRAAEKSGFRSAAKAAAVDLPVVQPTRALDITMADLVGAGGEFAVPGITWGMDVSDYLLAPVALTIDGHATTLTPTFDANCALISLRIDAGYFGEDAEGAKGDVTDILQKARAALGYGETLTAASTNAEVFTEDGSLVIVLNGTAR